MAPRKDTIRWSQEYSRHLGNKGVDLLMILSGLEDANPILLNDLEWLDFLRSLPDELSDEEIEKIRIQLYSELEPEEADKRLMTLYLKIKHGLIYGFVLPLEKSIQEVNEFFRQIQLPLVHVPVGFVPIDSEQEEPLVRRSDRSRLISHLGYYSEKITLNERQFIKVFYDQIMSELEDAIKNRNISKLLKILELDIYEGELLTNSIFMKITVPHTEALAVIYEEFRDYIMALLWENMYQSGLQNMRISYHTWSYKEMFKCYLRAPEDVRTALESRDYGQEI